MKKVLVAVCLLVVLAVPAMADQRVHNFWELEQFVAIHGGKVELATELPPRCRQWVRKYTIGDKAADFFPGIAIIEANGKVNNIYDDRKRNKGEVIYPIIQMEYQDFFPDTAGELMAMALYPIRKDGAELIEDGTAIRVKEFPRGWAVTSGYEVTTDDGKVYPSYEIIDSLNMGAVIKKLSGKIPTDGGIPTPNPQPEPDPQPQPQPDPQPTPNPQPEPDPQPQPQPDPQPTPNPQPEPDPQPQPEPVLPGPALPDPKPLPQDSGGGGCQAGAYGWLLAPVALWLKKKQR